MSLILYQYEETFLITEDEQLYVEMMIQAHKQLIIRDMWLVVTCDYVT